MLAEAVFPFYIIHQTIIVVVGWYLLQAGVAALPAFLILLVATALGCWLFYAIERRIGWLWPLIGLQGKARSEELRVGKEVVSTCGLRWSAGHKKKKIETTP